MRQLIRVGQLPEPRTNVRLHGVEVDVYWPELEVVVEVQSQKYHLAGARSSATPARARG